MTTQKTLDQSRTFIMNTFRVNAEERDFSVVLSNYLHIWIPGGLRILDICCGPMNEEKELRTRFAGRAEIIGIDSNELQVERAIKLGNFSARLGDVRNIKTLVKGKFNLVIGRNVPLGGEDSKGQSCGLGVFTDIADMMEEGSTLFLTLMAEREFHIARFILERLDFSISTAEKNRFQVRSDLIGVVGPIKDLYVIVAKAPTKTPAKLIRQTTLLHY